MGRFGLSLSVVVSHLYLPLWFLGQLAVRHDPASWMSWLVLAATYIVLISVIGGWSWFGRPARWILLALLVVTAWMTRPRHAVAPAPSFELVVHLAAGILFLALTGRALGGRTTREDALDLAFPLRGGVFHVGQGGASRIINLHFAHASQRYALDIVALNRAGVRARGLYPSELDRYAIWGAEVVSPCDGTVAEVVDGFPDRAPPERDPSNPVGNHVVIETDGATVYLAHLMCGSLRVSKGDPVSVGQLLGRVGNSGNTTEPHLHIHAERGAHAGQFSGRPGIAMKFGGRFLARNDRVTAGLRRTAA